MLKDLIQNFDPLIYNDTMMYGLAALGLCAFVGLYYLGEYLFSDRDPELDFSAE
jgi:hypothetical protein